MLYQQTLDASGVVELHVLGRLFLLDGTGAAPSVTVELTRGGSPVFQADGMKRGLRVFAANTFDNVRITGVAGQAVRFILGMDDVQISTSDGAAVSVPGGVVVNNTNANPVPVNAIGATFTAANVGILSPSALSGVVDVSALAGASAVIVAADAVSKEREVVVKNLFANTAAVRVGDATVAANKGYELQPGEAVVLNTLGAVSFFNPGAAPQSVCVLVNTRV